MIFSNISLISVLKNFMIFDKYFSLFSVKGSLYFSKKAKFKFKIFSIIFFPRNLSITSSKFTFFPAFFSKIFSILEKTKSEFGNNFFNSISFSFTSS